MARLARLAEFTSTPGSLTRLFLTPAHRAAAEQVAAWMREAGLRAEIDAIGNVVGRTHPEGDGRPVLLLGSHIDTVRDAGRYDGAFGVLAAVAALAELRERGEALPFAVEVIAFGDEEGVRFPVTMGLLVQCSILMSMSSLLMRPMSRATDDEVAMQAKHQP